MLLDIVLLLIGAATGFGAAFLLLRRKPIESMLDVRALPKAQHRFRVIMSTESGAQARTLYERLAPKGDGVVEFFDNLLCRGVKKA